MLRFIELKVCLFIFKTFNIIRGNFLSLYEYFHRFYEIVNRLRGILNQNCQCLKIPNEFMRTKM